jgi:hypothetical protein
VNTATMAQTAPSINRTTEAALSSATLASRQHYEARLREVAAAATAEDRALVGQLTEPQRTATSLVAVVAPASAALLLLEHNGTNRTIEASRLKVFEDLIRAGEFKATHQGAAFAKDGTLIDGQHRCLACAQTNIAIEMQFTFGIDKALIDYIDQQPGGGRTLASSLEIAGIENEKYKQALVRRVLRYQDQHAGIKARRSLAQLKRIVIEKDALYSAAIEVGKASASPPGMPPSFDGCLTVIEAATAAALMLEGGWHQTMIQSYLNLIQIGQDHGEHSPIVAVADILMRAKARAKGGVVGDSKIATVLKGAQLWATNTRSPRFRPVNVKKEKIGFTVPAALAGNDAAAVAA